MSIIRRCIPVAAALLLSAALALPAFGQRENRQRRNQQTTRKPAAGQTGDASKKLRAEWKVGDLKLQREAVDDTSFPAGVKGAAMQAMDLFAQQQEALLADVRKNPANEPAARKKRAQIEAGFRQKMAAVYNNPQMMAELSRCMKALDKEMDTLCQGADQMFAKLDAAGLTPAQKKQIAPAVKEASNRVKQVVQKSRSKSPKDADDRDEIVATFKDARQKVKSQLTKEQRQKLSQKFADES